MFVGGMHRTGTSMMRRLLGSHPALAIPPTEFEFFKRVGLPLHRPLTADRLDSLVGEILAWPKVREWGLDGDRVRANVRMRDSSPRGVFLGFLLAYAEAQGKARFGEKTVGYERQWRVLDRWFDRKLAFVHMIRSPIMSFASARRYGGVETAVDPHIWARMWNRSVLTGLLRSRVIRGRYLLVRYEDVVDDPQVELRRICAGVGLDYDDRMLSMSEYERKENSSFDLRGSEHLAAVRRRDSVDRAARVPAEELAIVAEKTRLAARLAGYGDSAPAHARSATQE